MNNEVPELYDIIENLQNDAHDLWKRIKALDGDRFTLRFCCNSQRVQRSRIEYTPRAVLAPKGEQAKGMPHEAADIIDACQNNHRLIRAIGAVSSSKLDILFICERFALVNWGFEEVS